MERKVGEVFTHNGKTFIVEPRKSCSGCYFIEICSAAKGKTNFGECAARNRKDNTDVIFKEIKENMETKELKIETPQGYEIDKEKSTFEKIVFKKIDSSPKSWKEYLDKVKPSYSVDERGNPTYWYASDSFGDNRLFLENQELMSKVIAYAKLLALREEWVKNEKFDTHKYIIVLRNNKPYIFYTEVEATRLSFPTKGMAEEFLDNFRDLIEKANGLY